MPHHFHALALSAGKRRAFAIKASGAPEADRDQTLKPRRQAH